MIGCGDASQIKVPDKDVSHTIDIPIHQVGGVTLKGHKTSIAAECWLIAASVCGYPWPIGERDFAGCQILDENIGCISRSHH